MKSEKWIQQEYDRLGKGRRKMSQRAKVVEQILDCLVEMSVNNYYVDELKVRKYSDMFGSLTRERHSIIARRKLLRRILR